MASLARKFAPLADRILVRRLVAKAQTAGGVYLPDSKLGKTNEGEVVAVGPGRVTESGTKIGVNVAVGERVLLPEYGGTTLTLGDEELSLFRDEDILGKFQSGVVNVTECWHVLLNTFPEGFHNGQPCADMECLIKTLHCPEFGLTAVGLGSLLSYEG